MSAKYILTGSLETIDVHFDSKSKKMFYKHPACRNLHIWTGIKAAKAIAQSC